MEIAMTELKITTVATILAALMATVMATIMATVMATVMATIMATEISAHGNIIPLSLYVTLGFAGLRKENGMNILAKQRLNSHPHHKL
ncbi:hypothetical protein G9A89_020261 [Geosiphon pyriformis]|nr:hypothetical protein G9A89_020261 [Geosiphon pyriformis]